LVLEHIVAELGDLLVLEELEWLGRLLLDWNFAKSTHSKLIDISEVSH
jgi:hypothetical protein